MKTAPAKSDYFAAVEMMTVLGGSFARSIADAAVNADSQNWARLYGAFPDLFDRYKKMAEAESLYRVTYVNVLDGSRRVLIGRLSKERAGEVARVVSDPLKLFSYMGEGVRIEPCDGTPDGEKVPE